MPSFPWKKVKKTSISQLMNCQSGSPLMVETGFPTSLVDLLVKNRARFKKKKPPPPPPVADPSPPPPPSPVNLPSMVVDDVSPLIRQDEKANHCVKMKKTYEQGSCNGGVSMNQGLMAVLKMFLVAALVLGINNFVLGITISAFLLFFLEYLGGFSSGVQRRVRLMIQGIFRAKVVVESEEYCVFKAPLQHQELSKDGCSDFGCQIQEIELLHQTDSECVRENIEECIWDEKSACVRVDVIDKGEESRYDLCESKEKKSHRMKIKSKMKKLVPKKFRKKKGSALESHMIAPG